MTCSVTDEEVEKRATATWFTRADPAGIDLSEGDMPGHIPHIQIRHIVLGEDETMKLAYQIADAASCLDDLKRIHAPAECADAGRHVANLHTIAEQFAGERTNEIYAQD